MTDTNILELQLYNTMSREKQVFQPIDPSRVTMYVCGPTVYNRVHIGNARPVVVFDTLYRVLKSVYPNVIYARNITDIDDKIMNAAAELGEDISVLSARYAEAYFEDMAALNNLEPTITPYATQHIPEMISMTSLLIDKGHAYESQGHVLFAVESMEKYGQLSGRSLDDMLAGARVEVADYKRYAGDFVLWKPSSDAEPGWDSPWGRGRPGWHLECSAMTENTWVKPLIYTRVGKILFFPIMRMKLPRVAVPMMASQWPIFGCTMVLLTLMAKRCLNLWVTFGWLKICWSIIPGRYCAL